MCGTFHRVFRSCENRFDEKEISALFFFGFGHLLPKSTTQTRMLRSSMFLFHPFHFPFLPFFSYQDIFRLNKHFPFFIIIIIISGTLLFLHFFAVTLPNPKVLPSFWLGLECMVPFLFSPLVILLFFSLNTPFSDGSEITEAVSCLVGVSRKGFVPTCFALDQPQAVAVDHTSVSGVFFFFFWYFFNRN